MSVIDILIPNNIELPEFMLTCYVEGIGVKSYTLTGQREGKEETMYLGVYNAGTTLPAITTEGPVIYGDHLMVQNSNGVRNPYYWNGSEWVMADKNMPVDIGFEVLQDSLWDAVNAPASSTTMSAYNIFVANMAANLLFSHYAKIRNLQIGSGGSGLDVDIYDYNNGSKVTPVFRVRYGGRTVFQIDPATGNVFFGEPNSDLKTAKTGFMYRASDQTIRSAGDNVIIKADGTIEAKDGTFSGTVNATAGEMTDITISGDSIFNGELQAASICTRPVSEEDTTPASGIFTTAEEIYKVIDEEFGINETQLYPCVVEGDDSIRYLSVHYTEFPEIEGYLYQIFFYNAEKKVMNTDDWITSCEVYAVTPEYPNGVIMDGPDASLNGRSQLTSMGYKEQGMDCYIVTRRKEAYSLSLSVFLNQILQVFVPLSSNGAGLKNNQVYRTSDGTLKVHIDNS